MSSHIFLHVKWVVPATNFLTNLARGKGDLLLSCSEPVSQGKINVFIK